MHSADNNYDYESTILQRRGKQNNIIQRKSVKHYAKQLQEVDNWNIRDDDDNYEKSFLCSNNSNKDDHIYEGSAYGSDLNSHDMNSSNHEINSSDQKGYFIRLLDAIFDSFKTFTKKSDSLVLKGALHSATSQYDETDNQQYYRIYHERACKDAKLFGSILQWVVVLVLLFLLSIGYNSLYRSCQLNDHPFFVVLFL